MAQEASQTISIGQQLAASGGMMVVITITHAVGLAGIQALLRLRKERLTEMDLGLRSIGMMSAMGLLLLMLHAVEIAMFAGFYLLIGALKDIEEALYYSASTYATLGRTTEFFPPDWRLMSAVEALIGFLMIGWSTAFIAGKVERVIR